MPELLVRDGGGDYMGEATTPYYSLSYSSNGKNNQKTSVMVGFSRSTPACLLGLKNQATLR